VLYLDLDGTVRWGKDELGRFVNGPGDVRIFNEVPALLTRYRRLKYRIVGITNQGGIALGYVTREQVAGAIRKTNRLCGDSFDLIRMCEHHPDADDPAHAICWCRKPRPGMIIEAAAVLTHSLPEEYYPPHLALVVGDRPEDAAAALAANIRFMAADVWRSGKHLDEITSDSEAT
jgi:D-glycero-D-manno-heptose 1,7-bisphosphate phosphatase